MANKLNLDAVVLKLLVRILELDLNLTQTNSKLGVGCIKD